MTFLGEEGTEQFTVTTLVNDERIMEQAIHDPFVRTTVRLKGWKHAWNALFSGIKINIIVNASEGAQRAIMIMDPTKLKAETEEIVRERAAYREARINGGQDFCRAAGLEA